MQIRDFIFLNLNYLNEISIRKKEHKEGNDELEYGTYDI